MTWQWEKLNECVVFLRGEADGGAVPAEGWLRGAETQPPPGADRCQVVSCYGYRL